MGFFQIPFLIFAKNLIMISIFRIIGYLEGISYLLLLFIGVPLKYYGGNEIVVKTLGMPHGLLFVAYLLVAAIVKPELNWKMNKFKYVILASIIPFGTFYIDKKYLRVS